MIISFGDITEILYNNEFFSKISYILRFLKICKKSDIIKFLIIVYFL